MARKPKKDAKKKEETAESINIPDAAGTPAGDAAPAEGPLLQILAQYTKDASFENPNAPDSLRSGQDAPAIDLNVEVKGTPMDDNTAEVTIMVSARAQRGDAVAFICELEYSGLFAFANVPADQIQALILIECPRILFPFARKIIADMTQDGGFPPLLLEPLDFAALYRQQNGGSQAVN